MRSVRGLECETSRERIRKGAKERALGLTATSSRVSATSARAGPSGVLCRSDSTTSCLLLMRVRHA
jgi:hypothetical protein